MDSLIGKTVKIKDAQILRFFYPEFKVRSDIRFIEDDSVIFIGKYRNNLKEYLQKETKRFINTVGKADIDLDNRREFLQFVFSKWDKKTEDVLTNTMVKYLLALDEHSFSILVKRFWVLGDTDIFNLGKGDSIEKEIWEMVGHNYQDSLQRYLELIKRHNENYIEMVLLRYIATVISGTNKPHTGINLEKIPLILSRYRKLSVTKRMKIVWLLMKLHEGDNDYAY